MSLRPPLPQPRKTARPAPGSKRPPVSKSRRRVPLRRAAPNRPPITPEAGRQRVVRTASAVTAIPRTGYLFGMSKNTCFE